MEMVFDASTLILLAKVTLLREIADKVKIIIPDSVRSECLIKESMDASQISTLIAEKMIKVNKTRELKGIKKLQQDFRIAGGEAQAILLARNIGCPLAVDDGQAIKVCKVFGQKFMTAIHFLLYLGSKNKMELPIAVEKLKALTLYGRYNRRIIEDAENRLKGEPG